MITSVAVMTASWANACMHAVGCCVECKHSNIIKQDFSGHLRFSLIFHVLSRTGKFVINKQECCCSGYKHSCDLGVSTRP